MANHFIWLPTEEEFSEKIAVCYAKNGSKERSEGLDNNDFLLNIYSMEKKIQSKFCRTEIKVIDCEIQQKDLIYGGLASGRIAIFDLKS